MQRKDDARLTVQRLVFDTLMECRQVFYEGKPIQFEQQKEELAAAITHFGWLCEQRGFYLSAEDIRAEIRQVTDSMKRHKADIKYFPQYLASALKKTVGQRAEELADKSKAVGWISQGALKKLTITNPQEDPPVVQLAKLYLPLMKRIKQRRQPSNAKQQKLL